MKILGFKFIQPCNVLHKFGHSCLSIENYMRMDRKAQTTYYKWYAEGRAAYLSRVCIDPVPIHPNLRTVRKAQPHTMSGMLKGVAE